MNHFNGVPFEILREILLYCVKDEAESKTQHITRYRDIGSRYISYDTTQTNSKRSRAVPFALICKRFQTCVYHILNPKEHIFNNSTHFVFGFFPKSISKAIFDFERSGEKVWVQTKQINKREFYESPIFDFSLINTKYLFIPCQDGFERKLVHIIADHWKLNHQTIIVNFKMKEKRSYRYDDDYPQWFWVTKKLGVLISVKNVKYNPQAIKYVKMIRKQLQL